MASRESKYERVEKVKVDEAGNSELKEVREDRGKEDPGMNFQDKRPADLVPGSNTGKVPNLSESELRNSSFNSTSAYGSSRTPSIASGVVEPSLARGEYSSSTSSRTSSGTGGAIGNAARRVEETVVSDVRKGENVSRKDLHKVEDELRGDRSSVHGSTHSSIRSEQSSMNPSLRSQPGVTGVTTQRTTIVTDQVQGVNQQRTVPIMPHQERQESEVIQHEQHSRGAETTIITVPSTRFESANLESTRTGRTYTEDKELTIPAPIVAPQIQSHQTVSLGGGTHAEISATTDFKMMSEAALKDMGPEEYARYRAKVEQLARQHEQQTTQKAATYRNQVEQDAELIRQTLERQHIRDIEFRKDLVECAVDRQQVEIQLEAEYAMRALENEREAARAALDQAKMSTNIDVNIDSAIGTTHSQGRVTTTSEARTDMVRGPTTATRI